MKELGVWFCKRFMFIRKLLMDLVSSWADDIRRKEELTVSSSEQSALNRMPLNERSRDAGLLSSLVLTIPKSSSLWRSEHVVHSVSFRQSTFTVRKRKTRGEEENLKSFSSSSTFLFISLLFPSLNSFRTLLIPSSSTTNETDIPVTARLHCHFLVSSFCSIQWRDKNLLRVEKWKMNHLLPAFKTITQV